MSNLLSKSGLSAEGQNAVCDIARKFISKNLNPHNLKTDVTTSDRLIYYEKFNSQTNCYEGEVVTFSIYIDEDCVITIKNTDTNEEYLV